MHWQCLVIDVTTRNSYVTCTARKHYMNGVAHKLSHVDGQWYDHITLCKRLRVDKHLYCVYILCAYMLCGMYVCTVRIPDGRFIDVITYWRLWIARLYHSYICNTNMMCYTHTHTHRHTHMHTYMYTGHKDVVELLLSHGSDPEHRNKAGCTPLMLAARYVCTFVPAYVCVYGISCGHHAIKS